jgi:hypothetical protein
MDHPAAVEELIGVYHADGSIIGELRYFVGARFGRAHCALCDITHATVREKREWRTCREGLGVPFTTVHLDERDAETRAASEAMTPCVLVRTASDLTMLLGPAELDECSGDPASLVAAVRRAADLRGLTIT